MLRVLKIVSRWVGQLWRRGPRRFHRDQVGAGYSLSVVLMLPLYIAFMAMTVEVHLLLNSHSALQAALQTAGHATRAWTVHQDALALSDKTLVDQVHQVVANNLLPFATSKCKSETQNDTLATVLRETGMTPTAVNRYAVKSAFIDKALRVSIQHETRATEGLLVQVEYDSPLWLPIFEGVWATGYVGDIPVRTVRAETWVALPTEESRLTNIGIPYAPQVVERW